MIRLTQSTIVLGRSDLREYERRRQRHLEAEALSQEFSRFAIDAPDGPTFEYSRGQYNPEAAADGKLQSLQIENGLIADPQDQPLTMQRPSQITPHLEHDEYGLPPSPVSLNTLADENPMARDLDDEHGCVTIGSEDPARDSEQLSAPSKDDFYYGGFVERTAARSSDNTVNISLSLAQDDTSTPQQGHFLDTSRIRGRAPLPRSPLFLSRNASSSPEHRPTSGLTPRVESSVAYHNTPGIMFALPARRMRRPPPRTFRHQTNSFSFDSSERASAAYDQERVASTSTNDSAAQPSSDLNLYEELRGSSLQSSRVTSRMSYNLSQPSVEDLSTIRLRDESERAAATLGDFLFSSPQLCLPPPFSTIGRTVSGVDVLPSKVEYTPPYLATSLIRSTSQTLIKSGVEGRRPSLHSSPSNFADMGEVDSSSTVRSLPQPPSPELMSYKYPRKPSPRSLVRRAAESVVDFHRNHSPLPNTSPSRSSSSASRRSPGRMASSELAPRTPSRMYQVYNDAIPRYSQPQTPAQLPEARHQSRFHPAYTAPVRRVRLRADRIESGMIEIPSLERVQQLPTPFRREMSRSSSPTGMSQSGFVGLYGGRENSDEEQHWAEGVRFSYAETRLWGFRDARNDGASLRETPEPEDWRVGRRN